MEDDIPSRLAKDKNRIRISGGVFEIHLAALVNARLRNLRRKHPEKNLRFRLATNVDGANPFDDIVLHLRWLEQGQQKRITYFVQMKHSEKTDKHVDASQLTAKLQPKSKKDFNLQHYYQKFNEIAKTLQGITEEKLSDTQSFLQKSLRHDFRLVFLTTAHVLPDAKGRRALPTLDFPFEDIFLTGDGEAFCFGESDNEVWNMLSPERDALLGEFLARLRVLSAQAQASELKPLLARALEDTLQAPPFSVGRLLERYCDVFHRWWSSDEGDCVSEENTELDEIVRRDVLQQVQQLRFQPRYYDALAQRLQHCDASYIVLPGIPPRLRASLVKSVLEKSHPGRYVILTKDTLEEWPLDVLISLCIKLCAEVTIVMDSLYEVSWEEFLERLLSEKKCKVRILASEWDECHFRRVSSVLQCDAWSEHWTMAQLEKTEQERFLRGRVCFQGYEINLSELSDSWTSMPQDIGGAALGCLATGRRLVLGAPLPQADPLYVPRTLEHRTVLNTTVFEIRNPENFFMLRDFPDEKLKTLRSRDSPWEEYSLVMTLNDEETRMDRPHKPNWRLWNTRNENSFNTSAWKNVHWLSFHKGEIIWEKTGGDSRCLIEHVKKMSNKCQKKCICFHEDTADFIKWKNTTIFLEGCAGAGKSTFVTKIANAIKKEKKFWCVLVVKISEGRTLDNISMKMKIHDILDGIHSLFTSSGTNHARTEKKFLKNCVNGSGNITVLVDGVDEVCPVLKDKALRFLEVFQKALEASGGRLWVAARTVLEEDVMRTLRCATPLKLRPFSREDQQTFLLSLWRPRLKDKSEEQIQLGVAALVDAVRETTASGDSSLCDVPLYTRMLADAYTAEELNNIFDNPESTQVTSHVNRFTLYKRYIDKVLSNILTRRGISESDQINLNLKITSEDTLKKHSQYGAFECFNDVGVLGKYHAELIETVNTLKDEYEREKIAQTGIISQVIDGMPKFVHFTIAEYLAALWLKDKYKVLPELTKSLYSGEFGEVRYFLDALLAEGHPLHEAALDGRPEAVEAALRREGQHVDAEDAGGRTALHLAALYGHEPAVMVLIEYGADVNVRDRVMGWSPLAYVNITTAPQTKNNGFIRNITQDVIIVEQLLRAKADPKHAKEILHDPFCFSLAIENDLHRFVELSASENKNYDTGLFTTELTVYGLAIKHGSVNVVKKFFDMGRRIRDVKKYLPSAAGRGYAHICWLLLHHKAQLEQSNRNSVSCNTELIPLTPFNYRSEERAKVINVRTGRGETPLTCAAEWDHEGVCRLLLLLGADVNAATRQGETGLFKAARCGHESVCRLLLENEAKINAATNRGETPLMIAANKGHESLCHLLLERDAKINAVTKKGESALFKAAGWGNENICRLLVRKGANVNTSSKAGTTPLMSAARRGCENVCRLLLELGAEVTAKSSRSKITALLMAAQKGHEGVCRLLLKYGAEINGTTVDGRTPLHEAAKYHHESVCRLLIKDGADLKCADVEGNTPLHMVTQNPKNNVFESDCKRIFHILLEARIEVNSQNKHGATALHAVAQKGYESIYHLLLDHDARINIATSRRKTALHLAAGNGRENICRLLAEHGADVNAVPDNGKTALHVAAERGYARTCRILLAHGADINAATCDRETVLYAAAKNGYENTCRVLIEDGADINAATFKGETALHAVAKNGHDRFSRSVLKPNAKVNASTSDAESAVHLVVENAHERTCSLLIQHGADINAVTSSGKTVFHTAVEEGNENICRLLLDKGAEINAADYDGNTVLHLIMNNFPELRYEFDHRSIFSMVLNSGIDVNSQNREGDTALHVLANREYHRLLETEKYKWLVGQLLENGANPRILNAQGQCPYDLALQRKAHQLCKILEE